ncbi:conserved hypothetical protein [Micrococcus luteus]|nr:conserved hypothetical protein [Micrococcus sp. 116]VXB55862.1 conserved hypothetical protein [Micrococcus luteus]
MRHGVRAGQDAVEPPRAGALRGRRDRPHPHRRGEAELTRDVDRPRPGPRGRPAARPHGWRRVDPDGAPADVRGRPRAEAGHRGLPVRGGCDLAGLSAAALAARHRPVAHRPDLRRGLDGGCPPGRRRRRLPAGDPAADRLRGDDALHGVGHDPAQEDAAGGRPLSGGLG